MADKPLLLVTRRMAGAVEDRLWDGAEIIARAERADAILACRSETFTADVIAQMPKSVRAIIALAGAGPHQSSAARSKSA